MSEATVSAAQGKAEERGAAAERKKRTITEIREFGHMNNRRGPYARPHMP